MTSRKPSRSASGRTLSPASKKVRTAPSGVSREAAAGGTTEVATKRAPGALLETTPLARSGSAPQPVDARTVAEIFARLSAANPEPRGELDYSNPYTLLVAVALSAQATDKSFNLATFPLFAIADTPQKMLELGEERLRHFIRTIGLFNTKAKNVIALSRILVERHGGEVPSTLAELESLPGVGTKTASVVLNIAFGIPRIAVDTHIFRIANRIPLAVAATTDKVQAKLEAIVPEPFRLHAHHWLILHGRYVCKARKPECPRCLIVDLCRYPDKTAPVSLSR